MMRFCAGAIGEGDGMLGFPEESEGVLGVSNAFRWNECAERPGTALQADEAIEDEAREKAGRSAGVETIEDALGAGDVREVHNGLT
jgi:hypothetical protein